MTFHKDGCLITKSRFRIYQEPKKHEKYSHHNSIQFVHQNQLEAFPHFSPYLHFLREGMQSVKKHKF